MVDNNYHTWLFFNIIYTDEMVRRYINEQEGKDVFEYSVFGSPNQKIGNFTGQKKLGDFKC